MLVEAALIGRQVGDFRLIELIGQGGMGVAYRAEQLTLGREAVVKLIAATTASEETNVRFLREARLASQLDHPYAAHVYAFGVEADGLQWIAMELVRGVPLNLMLQAQGPMPLTRFVPFFDRLCEVIYSAHEQGIIHRDIKPSNVMVVRRAGRMLPKLLDLGIARGAIEHEEVTGTLPLHDGQLGGGTGSVTIQGRVVGSPEYMAPEQWVDAARATARSDLYSLAVTAFEMLSGTRPFTGSTILQIAKAHARNNVPTLGAGLPSALDQVFVRALAKRASDRYGNVLELAAAIREVARDATRVAATDFDEVVRDTFVQGGPQPLAEALLELTAARNPDVAWESAWRVAAVLVRILGVSALAARTRIGEHSLDTDLTRRVAALIERGLDDEQWIALAAALVAPFAKRAQAHPIPELVGLFWGEGGPRTVFEDLFELHRIPTSDSADTERVHSVLVELGEVLRACAFLTDYSWVSESGELWMGIRQNPRDRRPFDPPTALGPDQVSMRGRLWLTDLDGVPLLELSPFAQIAPPAPGADDEAFLVDGPAKRGARSVAWPREFERYDDGLWQFVHEHLARLGDRETGTERDVTPYRGLASFGAGDAAMFFGREREVEAVVNRLRVHSLIAVVGPSGVGKSSFVHAGVLPALPESWQTVSFRPGVSPLVAIEARLEAIGMPAQGLADRLRDDPSALAKLLASIARRQATQIVVVIDQLEEIFTQCRDQATRDQLARALVAIDHGDSVRIVATLRDDFLVRAAELPGLGPRLSGALELVTLPDPPTLRRILVEPLQRVGYRFETEELPDEMVATVREHPGALALLSFAASKLWELRDRSFRHIPRRAYDAIGGVAGALARQAEDTLLTVPEADHGLVRELFRHLVTSEGTRAALRRSEAIQLLGKGPAAERVIETLVESRLIVGYEGAGQTDWIEVVHEALLSAWPRLVTWQREDAEGARLRDQVRSAARQWGDRGRPRGMLWRGEALVEYRLWRVRHGAALTDLEQDFASASIADETRSRRVRRSILATVVVGLILGLIVLQRANRIAEHNAAESHRVALASFVEEGRSLLASGHPEDAMVYLAAAYQGGAEDPNLLFMLGVGDRALAGQVAILSHPSPVSSVIVTKDGARIITFAEDDNVRVWNAKTYALERSISTSGDGLWPLAQTSDGGLLVVSDRGAPTVWEPATGARRFTLGAIAGSVARVASDGQTIVTLAPDGTLATWDARDGAARGAIRVAAVEPLALEVAGDRFAVSVAGGTAVGSLDLAATPAVLASHGRLALGASGRWLAVTQGREVALWDLNDPHGEPRILSGHAGEIVSAVFSPDGNRLATASMDHAAKIWDVSSGRMSASLDGHDGYVLPIAWSPDGSELATGSIDRTARLWDTRTGAARAVFYGHTDVVYQLAFTPAGDHLVTASFDGTTRIFDTRGSTQALYLDHRGPLALRFSGDAARLLATGHDGSAWIIDVATRTVLARIDEYYAASETERVADFSKRVCGDIDMHGETIALPVGKDVRLIRLADRAHPVVLGPHSDRVTCARFAPHGGVIAATDDGKLSFWSAKGKLERTIKVSDAQLGDLEIDPSSGEILASSGDGAAHLLDVAGAPVRLFKTTGGFVNGAAMSHAGVARVATANQDTVVRVFDGFTGAMLVASHSVSDLQDVDFSRDDRQIAVANSEGTITVFDSADGRLLARYGGAAGWMSAVRFAPRGDLLVAGDDRGEIQFLAMTPESRSASVVAADIACRVPFVLVNGKLIARPVEQCGR